MRQKIDGLESDRPPTALCNETPSSSGQRQSVLQLFLTRIRATQQGGLRPAGGRREVVGGDGAGGGVLQRLNSARVAITHIETPLHNTQWSGQQ